MRLYGSSSGDLRQSLQQQRGQRPHIPGEHQRVDVEGAVGEIHAADLWDRRQRSAGLQ
jgi:hypothetical protein